MAIYGEIKLDIGKILRQLCQQKNVEIIEAELCKDHVQMLMSVLLRLAVFHSFVENCVVNTAEAAELLDCSRQNVDDLVRRIKLHPIRATPKNKLFLKSELMERLSNQFLIRPSHAFQATVYTVKTPFHMEVSTVIIISIRRRITQLNV